MAAADVAETHLCMYARCHTPQLPGEMYCDVHLTIADRSASRRLARLWVAPEEELQRQAMKKNGFCLIYAIRVDRFIKIGMTYDLPRRVRQLQTSLPWELEVMGCTIAKPQTERLIHKHLKPHNVRGEWFEPEAATLRIVRFITENDGKGLMQHLVGV